MTDALQNAQLGIQVYSSVARESEPLFRQVVAKSRQRHIQMTTPRDAAERFSTIETLKLWLDSGRIACLLVGVGEGENSDVAGIAWFGQSEHAAAPLAKVTFALRLYEGWLGRGLATPFASEAHDIAHDVYGAQTVWLETDTTNTPAISTYKAIGYSMVSIEAGRMLMTTQLGRMGE
jgi:RimJ/RimL family protein N-acetyltransferase